MCVCFLTHWDEERHKEDTEYTECKAKRTTRDRAGRGPTCTHPLMRGERCSCKQETHTHTHRDTHIFTCGVTLRFIQHILPSLCAHRDRRSSRAPPLNRPRDPRSLPGDKTHSTNLGNHIRIRTTYSAQVRILLGKWEIIVTGSVFSWQHPHCRGQLFSSRSVLRLVRSSFTRRVRVRTPNCSCRRQSLGCRRRSLGRRRRSLGCRGRSLGRRRRSLGRRHRSLGCRGGRSGQLWGCWGDGISGHRRRAPRSGA